MPITIYADANIYRYVATGELEIITIGNVQFGYSNIHFEEMIRTGNTEMLKGMEALRAVPIVTNENGEHDIDSIGVCLEYKDPFDNYEEYQKNRIPTEEQEASLNELLLRFLGADNLSELRNVPQSIIDIADEAMEYGGTEAEKLATKARNVATDMKGFIENDLSDRRPLAETRKEFGYPKGATSIHNNDENPLKAIWARLEPKFSEATRDQFFGFEPIPGVEVEKTRLGEVAGCHLILNMLGYHPDNGLPKREKIRNIVSDGQHLGYGSICGGFLTSDHRLYKKAKAIFEYRNYESQALHVKYKNEGMSVTLVEPGAIKKFRLERDNGT